MSAIDAGPRATGAGAAPLGQAGDGFAILACVVTVGVSGFVLQAAGVNYMTEGGSLFQKVHPGTWAALISWLCYALRQGNPLTYLAITGDRNPGSAIFVTLLLLMMAYNALVQKNPVSLYFDTFLAPVALFWILGELNGRRRRALRIFLHAFMTANAILGIYELLSGFRLSPYFVVGVGLEQIVDDWRSSAFLGHPLANSSLTAIYILIVAMRREMHAGARVAMVALQLVAMNAFGGRAATVMVLFSLALVVAWHGLQIVRGARLSIRTAAFVALLVPLAIGAVAALLAAGFFDQFIERFSNDGNSAAARVLMFTLFNKMSLDEFLFGSNFDTIFTQQYLEGFEYGIESFWIASIITQGLVMSLMLWAGMFLFFRDLVRATSLRTIAPIGMAIAIASTSLSLGGKGSMLAVFVCFTMLLQDLSQQKA